jgi:hypothetical protein
MQTDALNNEGATVLRRPAGPEGRPSWSWCNVCNTFVRVVDGVGCGHMDSLDRTP